MIRTYRYRLYPNRTQAWTLARLLETHRTIYNDALTERREAWRQCRVSASYKTQAGQLKAIRAFDEEAAFANYSSLQHTLRRLDKAFAAFFRRVKAGQTPGYPRYKGRARFDSFEYTYSDGCKLRDVDGKVRFYVQNAGLMRIKYHRPIPEGATIKHVIIRRQLGKWYAYLMWEAEDAPAPVHNGPAVGIDVGLHHLLALSDGTTVENPRWLRHGLADLRVAQRRLSRRKKGSNRRRKAAFQVAKRHGHIANVRHDFWHKVTRTLADTYSLIALEDLSLAFMIQNEHLALSAHDAALGEFRQMLDYKAEYAGSQVVLVNPRNTSQVCSRCGSLVPKTLDVRVHSCPDCGLTIDRDVNAALNILTLARTGPSGPNVSQHTERALRSRRLQATE